jgi:inactivated superfamily I helicase
MRFAMVKIANAISSPALAAGERVGLASEASLANLGDGFDRRFPISMMGNDPTEPTPRNCLAVSTPAARAGIKPQLIMQVHDEIVFECDTDDADALAENVKEIMESVATLSVPLRADTTIATEWGK